MLLFSEVKRISEELKQKYTTDTALGAISDDSVLLMAQETEAQIEVSFSNGLRFIDNKLTWQSSNCGIWHINLPTFGMFSVLYEYHTNEK